jgi:uncharacterized pyridoxal phosphate-containing UPF0001 family protein
VNLTGAAARGGCEWDEIEDLVRQSRDLGLNVRGLMGVGPPSEGRSLFAKLAQRGRQLELPELSIGMSNDLEVAVEEGSTMVRVGTALFGPRDSRG